MRRGRSDHRQLLLVGVVPLPALTYKLRPYWEAAMTAQHAASIEAAILSTYQRTGSLIQTGQTLAFSTSTIYRKLKALRAPIKPRGGNNNPYGRAGKPDAKNN